MTLLDLPDSLLWSIISQIFGEQVLLAFQASYSTIPNNGSARAFVDEKAAEYCENAAARLG